MRRTLKKLRSLVLTAAIIPMIFATPAHAIFGFGDIVIDPTNLIQNALTATRTLQQVTDQARICLLYTSPSPRDATLSRMPSSA